MTNTRCEHIWVTTPNQYDTGKLGIRQQCKKCNLILVNIKKSKSELQSSTKGDK